MANFWRLMSRMHRSRWRLLYQMTPASLAHWCLTMMDRRGMRRCPWWFPTAEVSPPWWRRLPSPANKTMHSDHDARIASLAAPSSGSHRVTMLDAAGTASPFRMSTRFMPMMPYFIDRNFPRALLPPPRTRAFVVAHRPHAECQSYVTFEGPVCWCLIQPILLRQRVAWFVVASVSALHCLNGHGACRAVL